ncbi:Rho-GAP domain-containing protein [Entamoeba marina]
MECNTNKDSYISDEMSSDMIKRAIFLHSTTTICHQNQTKKLAELDELIQTLKQTLKTLSSDKVDKKIRTSYLSSSPAFACEFLDSYKRFCEDGFLFYKQQKEGVWNERSKQSSNVVLYSRRTLKQILIDEQRTDQQIPRALEQLISHLKKNCMVEGIFRISAKNSLIEDLLTKMAVTDFTKLSVIENAAVLKRYVRDIPGGLIDVEVQNSIIKIWDLKDLDVKDRIKQVKMLVQSLSSENYLLLKEILELLNIVYKNESKTRMSAEALAICWSPVLFDLTDLLAYMKEITEIVRLLIINANDLY